MPHEQLWAPWRLAFIKGEKDDPPEPPGCFLCRYRDEDRDAENFVVARGADSLVVLNRYPYNNGHLLVAPRGHVARLEDLDEAVLLDTCRQLQRMTATLTKLLNPQGFNVGLNQGHVAGAGLPGHMHWHIVPRWDGDTNFMPVLGDTKVIPQSLEALYRLLRDALDTQPTASQPIA
jgi:ATP adenylyltransferase